MARLRCRVSVSQPSTGQGSPFRTAPRKTRTAARARRSPWPSPARGRATDMSDFTHRQRRLVGKTSVATLIGAGLAVNLLAGVAYAYWSTTGSGGGSDTGSSGLSQFHTTAEVAQGSQLYPGGIAPLTLNIDNSGSTYALKVTEVALDTSRSITVTDPSGSCTNTAILVST